MPSLRGKVTIVIGLSRGRGIAERIGRDGALSEGRCEGDRPYGWEKHFNSGKLKPSTVKSTIKL